MKSGMQEPADESFERFFAELVADYRRGLPEKFAELDALWKSCDADKPATGTLERLKHELHALVGTAQTMSLVCVTEAARRAECFLDPFVSAGCIAQSADRARFTQLLGTLQRSAEPRQESQR